MLPIVIFLEDYCKWVLVCFRSSGEWSGVECGVAHNLPPPTSPHATSASEYQYLLLIAVVRSVNWWWRDRWEWCKQKVGMCQRIVKAPPSNVTNDLQPPQSTDYLLPLKCLLTFVHKKRKSEYHRSFRNCWEFSPFIQSVSYVSCRNRKGQPTKLVGLEMFYVREKWCVCVPPTARSFDLRVSKVKWRIAEVLKMTINLQ